MKDLLSIKDLERREIKKLLSYAMSAKRSPRKYKNSLRNKTLLLLFSKPSLRTYLSFAVAMNEMGGQAVNLFTEHTTLGKKETWEDMARTAARMVDGVAIRWHEHKAVEDFAKAVDKPVINALTNATHPCQGLSDLLTLQENVRKLKGSTLSYLGDANNNVTHSLLYACSKMGVNMVIACPKKEAYQPDKQVLKEAKEFAHKNKSIIKVIDNPKAAVKVADAVYTDTWMSYHIAKSKQKQRLKDLKPFQVNNNLLKSNKEAVVMHCLPAQRDEEITSTVMDGPQSVIFDQAENRLHMAKAILVRYL